MSSNQPNSNTNSSPQYFENRQPPPSSSEWSIPYIPTNQTQTVSIPVQYESRQPPPSSSDWSKPYMP